MAQIPSYDKPQVQERALPGVYQDDTAGAPALNGGAAADDMVRAGSSMLGAGNAVAAAAYQMQEKENLEAVQAATTAYGERVLEFKINAQKTRTLHGARGLTTDFSDFHKKTLEEVERNLGNAAQRQAFRSVAQRAGLGTRQELATFEIGQTNAAELATHKATQQTFVNIGATALTDDVVEENKAELVRMTRAFAATRNLDEVTTKGEVDKAVAEFHANRVHHLARTDPEGALNYFKKVEKEIADPELRGKIGDFADKIGAEGMGVRVGGEITGKLHSGRDTDPFEVDKMQAAAREHPSLKNNPVALKATLANIDERRAAFERGKDARSEALIGRVSTMILGGASMGQVRASPDFQMLPGNVQLQIGERMKSMAASDASRAAANEARADAAESRRDRRLNREAYPAVLRLMTEPEKLASMTKDQVLSLLPQIGIQHTENLLQLQDKFKANQSALSEGKIDNEDFKMIAQGAGWDVEKAKGDDARQLIGLRSQVEREIGMEQQKAGGKLSREQKVQIMQRVIDNKVMMDRRFWPDPERTVATVPADQLKNAYVVIGGQEVRLNSIPPTDRQQIISARQRRGLSVTEEDIARTWLARNPPKRNDGLK